MGAALFVRDARGRFVATSLGAAVVTEAETMAETATRIAALSGRTVNFGGKVRITSVPFLVQRWLIPALSQLRAAHPDLEIELVPASESLSLTQREADIAVKFARPQSGGHAVLARKLGVLGFSVFAPVGAPARDLGWISYDDAHAHLPQARWLAAQPGKVDLRVSDMNAAWEAVAAGLGKTLLPFKLAGADARLTLCPTIDAPPLPSRQVWLLSLQQSEHRSAIKSVKAWLTGLEL